MVIHVHLVLGGKFMSDPKPYPNQFYQKNFGGGLDQLNKDTDIADNAYRLLINGRSRFGSIIPIPTAQDVTNGITGHKQGLYSFGTALLMFNDGLAYYKVEGSAVWLQVIGFSMDADVDYIYTAAVPASNRDFLRQAVLSASNTVDANGGIVSTNTFTVSGTPSGVVCQDGINQPMLITYNPTSNIASARVLGTYDSWANNSIIANDREYVPVGRQMMFFNNILFVVSTDTYTIFRSVSGRPLDFMVNVDQDGNKLATESLGGARTVSFAQSFETINLIEESTTVGIFLIGTANFIYGMSLDFTTTIFGEPTFTKAFTIKSGVVNQFSTADKNGDTVFTDYEGAKTFNGVQQFRFEGRNDNFSLQLARLLVDPATRSIIKQRVVATTQFDNYNIFALKTSLGYAAAIYDNLREVWNGLDITAASAEGIKQFAITTTPSSDFLYCITAQNHVFALYRSDNTATEVPILQTKSWVNQSDNDEHKTLFLHTVFLDGTTDGTLFATEIVDEKRGQKVVERALQGNVASMNWPLYFPITFYDTNSRISNVTLTLNQGTMGQRIGAFISWNTNGSLQELQLQTQINTTVQSRKQQSKAFTS